MISELTATASIIPARSQNLEGNLDEMRLKEVAAHEQVRLFEIKLSQGAKPGKGGMLPGEKVTAEIARVRGIRTGENAFSPNRHRDIANNADLLEMIGRIRTITGKPVGFKTVLGGEAWLDSLFSDIQQRGAAAAPDFICLDGAEGGTDAADRCGGTAVTRILATAGRQAQ